MLMWKAGTSGFGWGARLMVVAAAGVLAFAASASRGAENTATPLKLRFGGDNASTRVVLELSEAVSGEVVSNGAADGHVVLDFSQLTVGDSLDGQGKGLVKAWSIDKAHGRARLSLDLNGHGHVRRRFLLPPGDGVSVYRYVLDIDADGPAAKAPAAPRMQVAQSQTIKAQPAQTEAPPAAGPGPIPALAQSADPCRPPLPASRIRRRRTRPWRRRRRPRCPTSPPSPGAGKPGMASRRAPSARAPSARALSSKPRGPGPTQGAPFVRKIIVIDAGHGGHDPGALGGRSHEKDVTLAAAKALKARLEQTGRFKVVLTRDSDVYIPLEQRVKIARSAGADSCSFRCTPIPAATPRCAARPSIPCLATGWTARRRACSAAAS